MTSWNNSSARVLAGRRFVQLWVRFWAEHQKYNSIQFGFCCKRSCAASLNHSAAMRKPILWSPLVKKTNKQTKKNKASKPSWVGGFCPEDVFQLSPVSLLAPATGNFVSKFYVYRYFALINFFRFSLWVYVEPRLFSARNVSTLVLFNRVQHILQICVHVCVLLCAFDYHPESCDKSDQNPLTFLVTLQVIVA